MSVPKPVEQPPQGKPGRFGRLVNRLGERRGPGLGDGIHETIRIARRKVRRAIGNPSQQTFQPVPVGLGKIVQDMARNEILVPRMADSQSDTPVVGADMAVDGPQAVMPRMSPARLDPRLAGRKVDLVMKYRHIGGGEFVEPHGLAHRLTRPVLPGPANTIHNSTQYRYIT